MGLYDYVTTKHFLANILYFKAYKKPDLAFQILVNIWQTIVHFKQLILVHKYLKENTSISGEMPPWLHSRYTTI